MSDRIADPPEGIVPFAPKQKARPEGNFMADDSGHAIIALLKKAADTAKEDCARALDVAHKLSFEIRAVEERARKAESEAAHFRDRTSRAEAEAAHFRDSTSRAESEAAHFRDRATRAENWLVRIHSEIEQTFFQKKERGSIQTPTQREYNAPPNATDGEPIVENDRSGRRR
jgi:hypothetical protein